MIVINSKIQKFQIIITIYIQLMILKNQAINIIENIHKIKAISVNIGFKTTTHIMTHQAFSLLFSKLLIFPKMF